MVCIWLQVVTVSYLGPQVVCQGGEDAYYGQEGDQGGVQVPGGGQEGTWGRVAQSHG